MPAHKKRNRPLAEQLHSMTGLTTVESMLKSMKSKDSVREVEAPQRPIVEGVSSSGCNSLG